MMLKMSALAIRVIVYGVCVWEVVKGMRFELESAHAKCITEEIKMNVMTVAKYSVVNPHEGYPMPDELKINVKVTSPRGNIYHHSDHADSGKFAFTAAEGGDYMVCFYAPNHTPPRRMAIEFDWRTGVAAKDWSSVAKKGHVEVMEVELRKLLDKISSIHDEMFYLREREEEMQKLNRSTNSHMATFGFLSLLLCLSVAGLQFYHLKSFFERKKLL